MGSFHSVQSRDERRRSNRLSKPPTNKLATNSPHLASNGSPTAWQNPWTGRSIPISPTDFEFHGRRPQSFPSVPFQPEVGWTDINFQYIPEETEEMFSNSPNPSSGASGSVPTWTSVRPTRQRSLRPATLQSHPRSPLVPGQPTRSYSIQSLPNKTKGSIFDGTLEEATSSNTHFMVDNPGFSLMRRRSLLTRPGIATRRSRKEKIRRLPSPIDQEVEHYRTSPSDSEGPAIRSFVPLSRLRPPTPSDFEYTHLGALKLGTLRVVNATSPCPSDRTGMTQPLSSTPEAGQSYPYRESWHPEGEHQSLSSNREDIPTLAKRKSASMIHIPPLDDYKRKDDLPESPFSFDKSPTNITVHGQNSRLSKEAEDEGVFVFDDEKIFNRRGLKTTAGDRHETRFFKSHRKVDSGYSSVISGRSSQDNPTRTSIDSQASAPHSREFRRFTLGGSSRDIEIWNGKISSEAGNQLPMHRHLSLQGHKANSRAESGWPTLCHETQQTVAKGRVRSSSFPVSQGPNQNFSFPRYCAQLRTLEPPSIAIPHSSKPPMESDEIQASGGSIFQSDSPTQGFPGLPQVGYEPEPAGQLGKDATRSGRISKSKLQQAAVEVPLLPTFPTPKKAEIPGNKDSADADFEPPRGRNRSRSIEYQRRRIAKQQKRPYIYMATSPFIFH